MDNETQECARSLLGTLQLETTIAAERCASWLCVHTMHNIEAHHYGPVQLFLWQFPAQ
jgi:hypothetical protein